MNFEHMNSTCIKDIIKQLTDIEEGRLWLGENFRKKLDQLTAEEAMTRPLPGMHSVAEIISHLTVWRKDAILKITTGRGRLVEQDEENWKTLDDLKAIGWTRLRDEFYTTRHELIRLIETKDDSFLHKGYFDNDYKGNYNYLFLLHGMIHHDIYHLGQIGLVIRMLKEQRAGEVGSRQ